MFVLILLDLLLLRMKGFMKFVPNEVTQMILITTVHYIVHIRAFSGLQLLEQLLFLPLFSYSTLKMAAKVTETCR
jgi:hypothetical protein